MTSVALTRTIACRAIPAFKSSIQIRPSNTVTPFQYRTTVEATL